MKAEPRPWKIGGTFFPNTQQAFENIYGPTAPGDQSGTLIAQKVSPANAALIVRAVNCHEELLEALVNLASFIDPRPSDKPLSVAYAKAHAAIAKAEAP